MSETTKKKKPELETVEPIGNRVLIRKDEDKKQTKSGIHLPDKIEIPTLTGRVVTVSAQIDADDDYPIQQYDRVLFNPKDAIPVDFEGDNRLFVVPIENIVAVFMKLFPSSAAGPHARFHNIFKIRSIDLQFLVAVIIFAVVRRLVFRPGACYCKEVIQITFCLLTCHAAIEPTKHAGLPRGARITEIA